MLISAEEARKRAEAYEPKWNILDTIQLKRIELRIKFWSHFGHESIRWGGFLGVRPLVQKKLEGKGYRLEMRGARDMCWEEIYF